MTYSAILESLHEQLQWPEPPTIYQPQGSGPAVYARLARRKLAEPLRQRGDARNATVGILSTNPDSDDSDAPVAIVCEFPRPITQGTVREAHRLAWNFCRSPLLITIEPHLIRSWSCYETPNLDELFPPAPVEEFGVDDPSSLRHLADSLHWIELASGSFLARRPDRFPSGQRADETLLENLGHVREKLTSELPEEIAHDLLARLIFIQFLFHRKDSGGRPALNASVLGSLHEKGILSRSYTFLREILRHKGDTYALFEWLDERFNGDLFPDDWREEKACVRASHLRMLADFVRGDLQMRRGQRCLWPLYSFDAIPLEFVSSIYEEFVARRDERGVGEHYTPPHIVDFVLDKVLPWGGTDYDVRVLDPACGSAAFLVKAFERLVNRWRTANPDQEPPASFLRGLLENNLFGVDTNPAAVRVASFSLYLAMCDEIDPRHYWRQVRFPRLREVTLRKASFFREDVPRIRSNQDAESFDLVVGNAPWGDASVDDLARQWADARHWPTADEQIGPLFLSKAAELAAEHGTVSMIQPAGSVLFNRSTTALQARRELFTRYKVEEIVNLSALRFKLFPEAVGPACVITMRPTPSDGEPIAFSAPKETYRVGDEYRVVIDAHDLNWVSPEEAATDPVVWSALTWGGRRDLELVRRLGSDFDTLADAVASEAWEAREGFIRGAKRAQECSDRLGLPILEDHDLWAECRVVEDAARFPENENPMFERPRVPETYRLPLLLTKESWTVSSGRFRGVVVMPTARIKLLLFSQSFMGIRAPHESHLATLALVINSSLAVHYFYLTSGRLASYRPTLRKVDLEQIPLPQSRNITLEQLASMGEGELDAAAFDLFGLKDVERVLVDDFLHVTLEDFKGHACSPGRAPLTAAEQDTELRDYCKWFIEVLQAGFGADKAIAAKLHIPLETEIPPYCIVSFHFDMPQSSDRIEAACLNAQQMRQLLHRLGALLAAQRPEMGGVFYQRVARVYLAQKADTANGAVLTAFIIKPNARRYWTRSIALRDADEVATDILQSNLISTE